jgi:hypothetical protein
LAVRSHLDCRRRRTIDSPYKSKNTARMSAPAAAAASTAAPINLNEKQQQAYDLITRNLQEVLGEDIIKSKMAKDELVKCYWGGSASRFPI